MYGKIKPITRGSRIKIRYVHGDFTHKKDHLYIRKDLTYRGDRFPGNK